MNNLIYYFLLFFIYSVIGWFLEVINCSLKAKRFVMRGFLIGPYCPIYGASAILMIVFLKKYESDLVALFLMAAVITTIVEYITSYLMEKAFGIRWWDYSKRSFNINGRVCLVNSIAFGLLGVLLFHFINPVVAHSIDLLSSTTFSLSFYLLASLITVDFILTLKIVSNLKLSITHINKDYTELVDKRVWSELMKKKAIYQLSLYQSFPNLKLVTKKRIK